MPVRYAIATDTFVEIVSGNRIFHLDYVDIPSNLTLSEQKEAKLLELAQNWLDFRIKLKDLPADDPDKITDPARPDLFWEGTGGNTVLVSRPVIIENITWDGSRFFFSLRANK